MRIYLAGPPPLSEVSAALLEAVADGLLEVDDEGMPPTTRDDRRGSDVIEAVTELELEQALAYAVLVPFTKLTTVHCKYVCQLSLSRLLHDVDGHVDVSC